MTGRLPYRYRANGLDIASAMELPELHGGDGRPDARIVYGEVPACLDRPTLRGPHAQTRRDECLLTVRNVARYWIRAGREVIVAPDAGADPADVRVFLLSSAMGALAHQNRLLPLHASAADVGGEAVLFVGQSGSGKSTLMAELCRRGHRLVTDDIASISLDAAGRPRVHAGYRHLRLWRRSIDALEMFVAEPERLRQGIEKFRVLPDATAALDVPDALPVRCIFVLTQQRATDIHVRAVSGLDRINLLLRGTYRFRLLAGMGDTEHHHRLCQSVASQVPILTVERPFDLRQLGTLATAVEHHFAGSPAGTCT